MRAEPAIRRKSLARIVVGVAVLSIAWFGTCAHAFADVKYTYTSDTFTSNHCTGAHCTGHITIEVVFAGAPGTEEIHAASEVNYGSLPPSNSPGIGGPHDEMKLLRLTAFGFVIRDGDINHVTGVSGTFKIVDHAMKAWDVFFFAKKSPCLHFCGDVDHGDEPYGRSYRGSLDLRGDENGSSGSFDADDWAFDINVGNTEISNLQGHWDGPVPAK
jgi:hypothetical protein